MRANIRLRNRIIWFVTIASLVTVAIIYTGIAAAATSDKYITWKGIGPDKWASAWLIHRHLDPGARVEFIQFGSNPKNGIIFDIPEHPPYMRDGRETTFEKLVSGFGSQDPILRDYGSIIHDIEVNYWGGKQSQASPFVEKAYRDLQFKFGRENVPRECYFQLFDALYSYMKEMPEAGGFGPQLENSLRIHEKCGSVKYSTAEQDKKFVKEWRPAQVLQFIGAGDKVVFVDAREADEYEEGHIPGAVNMTLRSIGPDLPEKIRNADVVIAYCIKDFRGFEVAKRLKLLGVQTVGIMNPYGLAGWKSTGLPVAGSRGLSIDAGSQKLYECGRFPSECIKND